MSDYSQKRTDEARGEHDRRQSDRARFADFATDLTRTNGLVLSKPAQLFGVPPLPDPNLAAALADEFFAEGRNHRRAPAPVNIAET